jgi:hypothetical protein
LESLWAIRNGFRKLLGNAQIGTRCHTIGEEAELLSTYWQKRGNFHPLSLKRCVSVYTYLLKVEGAEENFKNDLRFFSYFCSFQPYHS